MKLGLVFICTLLSSCIYVEGQIIKEPEDVSVRDSLTKLTYWERSATIDVTDDVKQWSKYDNSGL